MNNLKGKGYSLKETGDVQHHHLKNLRALTSALSDYKDIYIYIYIYIYVYILYICLYIIYIYIYVYKHVKLSDALVLGPVRDIT